MKKLYFNFLFLLFLLFYNPSFAQDSLTLKQQLDRIMEEVKDLNKAVFNKSFDNNQLYSIEENNDTERFTSIDIRIYDLEKDIKNLTLQFEDVLFKLDDISNEIISLENDIISKFENFEKNTKTINSVIETNESSTSIKNKEENSLGKLVITDNSNDSDAIISEDQETEIEQEKKQDDQEFKDFTSEEQLQFALDQMMKKNYDYSKEILEDFIIKYPDNQLSGSAHFWLGKIFLFETNYRKAAIIFGEGVQKFPESIKAAEMYYELAKSLKEMDKIPETCKTLTLLEQNYIDNKFAKDPEKIKTDLNCNFN